MTRGDVRAAVAEELDRQLAERRRAYAHDLFLQGKTDTGITAAVARLRRDDDLLCPHLTAFVANSVLSSKSAPGALTRGQVPTAQGFAWQGRVKRETR